MPPSAVPTAVWWGPHPGADRAAAPFTHGGGFQSALESKAHSIVNTVDLAL